MQKQEVLFPFGLIFNRLHYFKVKEDLRKELYDKLRETLLNELRGELRGTLKDEVKREVIRELLEKVKTNLTSDWEELTIPMDDITAEDDVSQMSDDPEGRASVTLKNENKVNSPLIKDGCLLESYSS